VALDNCSMKAISILFRSIALVCYYVSMLFPRKSNRWLFGSATGFNNNAKYFFIDVVENHPEIKAYWIDDRKNTALVRQLGYKAYSRFSLIGLWLCLTSKYYIVDHTQGCIDFWTSGGAKIINLWHGVGWKACLWSNPFHAVYKQKNWWANYVHRLYYPHLYYKPDLLLSSSPYMTEHFFAPMFDVPEKQCVEDDYPRVKFMLQPQAYILNHIRKIGATASEELISLMQQYNRVILYAPTFRDAQYDFIAESGIDFDDLNELMACNNWLFLVKFHPSTRIMPGQKIAKSNVILLDKNVDSNYIMPFTDVLLSDYSSIVFDFMRLSRQMVLFPFDKEQYNSGSRVFQMDYDDLVEGIPQAFTYNELKDCLLMEAGVQQSCNEKLWRPTMNLMTAILKL